MNAKRLLVLAASLLLLAACDPASSSSGSTSSSHGSVSESVSSSESSTSESASTVEDSSSIEGSSSVGGSVSSSNASTSEPASSEDSATSSSPASSQESSTSSDPSSSQNSSSEPEEPSLAKLTIENGESAKLFEGDKLTLKVTSEGLEGAAISFKSNDEGVATVDDKGMVTAIKKGTATITASANGASDAISITVEEPTIVFNGASPISLAEGNSLKLGDYFSTNTGSKIAFSYEGDVLEVGEDGTCTALKAGFQVTVKASLVDYPSVFTQIEVKTTAPDDSYFEVIGASKLELEIGDTTTVSINTNLELGEDRSITYLTSNPDAVKIEKIDAKNFKITALKSGSVTITFKLHYAMNVEFSASVDLSISEKKFDETVEKGALGLFQENLSTALYYAGGMSGFYLATDPSFDKAAEIEVLKDGDDYYLRDGDSYIGAVYEEGTDGKMHANVVIDELPYAWSYDAGDDAYLTTLSNEETYFIGVNYENKGFGIYGVDKIADADYFHASVVQAAIADPTPEPEPDPTPSTASISEVTKEGEVYSVEGEVVAKSAQAILIHDGTGALYVYDRNVVKDFNVGDYVTATGSVSKYNGILQMSYSSENGATPAEVALAEKKDVEIPAAAPLTADILANLDGNGSTKSFATSDIKKYSWTATVGESGGFETFNLEGSDTVIEMAYLDEKAFNVEVGKSYEIEAYFVGYAASHDYVAMMMTSLSEVGGTSEPDPEEPSTEEFTKLADVRKLANGSTFTTRAYYVGQNDKAANKGEMTYNAVYVADGDIPYMIYNASQEAIDSLDLVPGESIVEFTGTVSNYNGLLECKLVSIEKIDDATGLTTPVYVSLDKENPDIDLEGIEPSTKFVVNDAIVESVTRNSYGNATIVFTVGDGTTEYTLYLDSRYSVMDPVESLAEGDVFSTETFLNLDKNGGREFTYISNFTVL